MKNTHVITFASKMIINPPDVIFFQKENKIGVSDSIMLLDFWVL